MFICLFFRLFIFSLFTFHLQFILQGVCWYLFVFFVLLFFRVNFSFFLFFVTYLNTKTTGVSQAAGLYIQGCAGSEAEPRHHGRTRPLCPRLDFHLLLRPAHGYFYGCNRLIVHGILFLFHFSGCARGWWLWGSW